MRHLFFTSILWLVFVSSAGATSVEHPVTPASLDTYFYQFSVLTKATNDGVAFHVIITDKQHDIFPDSSVNVDLGSAEPPIPVTLIKEQRVWTADFTVSRKLLKNSQACFVFATLAHITVNGKTVAMPSADFYELRLADFLKP